MSAQPAEIRVTVLLVMFGTPCALSAGVRSRGRVQVAVMVPRAVAAFAAVDTTGPHLGASWLTVFRKTCKG